MELNKLERISNKANFISIEQIEKMESQDKEFIYSLCDFLQYNRAVKHYNNEVSLGELINFDLITYINDTIERYYAIKKRYNVVYS